MGDLATDGAEVRDEPGGRGVAEAVVVGDDRDGPPALLVVLDVAETGVPDRPVAVEPEEVRRLYLQRRFLRAGDAGEHRQVGVGLGVLGDGDALVSREWPDDDVGAELLDEPPHLLEDAVRGVVATPGADQFDRGPGDLGTGEPVERARPRLHRGTGVLHHREGGTGDDVLVESAERPFALAEDPQTYGSIIGRCRAGRSATPATVAIAPAARRQEHQTHCQGQRPHLRSLDSAHRREPPIPSRPGRWTGVRWSMWLTPCACVPRVGDECARLFRRLLPGRAP